MKTRKYPFVVLLIIFLSCSRQEESQTTETQNPNSDRVTLSTEQIKNANITTGPYTEELMATTVQVNGRLEAPPQNIVTISTPFGGFIKSIDLLQGMTIKKGQVVVILQHPDYIVFQQNYLELKSELEFLEAEYLRQQELAKDNINAQKTLQSSKSNYVKAKAKLDGLRARLDLMDLDVAQIEKGEFSSTIKLNAPIDGNITEINVNLGQFVNSNDVIVKIVDTRHLHVELKIFEKDIFKIRQGQTITFTLYGDQQTRRATVYLIGKEILPDRTITVHGHLEKEDIQLLPGMFLAAEIESHAEKVKVLPEEAIVNFEGESFVFASDGAGQYKIVKVKTGTIKNGRIEVSFPESINPDTQIVLSGAYSLLSVLRNGELEH